MSRQALVRGGGWVALDDAALSQLPREGAGDTPCRPRGPWPGCPGGAGRGAQAGVVSDQRLSVHVGAHTQTPSPTTPDPTDPAAEDGPGPEEEAGQDQCPVSLADGVAGTVG